MPSSRRGATAVRDVRRLRARLPDRRGIARPCRRPRSTLPARRACSNDCLTGAWGRSPPDERNPNGERPRLSAGDLDEAVLTLIVIGDDCTRHERAAPRSRRSMRSARACSAASMPAMPRRPSDGAVSPRSTSGPTASTSSSPGWADAGFEVIATEKDMVRLGHGGGDMKELRTSIDRGIAACARMRRIAEATARRAGRGHQRRARGRERRRVPEPRPRKRSRGRGHLRRRGSTPDPPRRVAGRAGLRPAAAPATSVAAAPRCCSASRARCSPPAASSSAPCD